MKIKAKVIWKETSSYQVDNVQRNVEKTLYKLKDPLNLLILETCEYEVPAGFNRLTEYNTRHTIVPEHKMQGVLEGLG